MTLALHVRDATHKIDSLFLKRSEYTEIAQGFTHETELALKVARYLGINSISAAVLENYGN